MTITMPDNAFDLAFQGKTDTHPQQCLYDRAIGMLAIQKGIVKSAEKLLKNKQQSDMGDFLALLNQWEKETVVFNIYYRFKEPTGRGLAKALQNFEQLSDTARGNPVQGISRNGDQIPPIEVNKLGLEIIELLLEHFKIVREFWDPIYEGVRDKTIKVKIGWL